MQQLAINALQVTTSSLLNANHALSHCQAAFLAKAKTPAKSATNGRTMILLRMRKETASALRVFLTATTLAKDVSLVVQLATILNPV